jgi:hypothetical protein
MVPLIVGEDIFSFTVDIRGISSAGFDVNLFVNVVSCCSCRRCCCRRLFCRAKNQDINANMTSTRPMPTSTQPARKRDLNRSIAAENRVMIDRCYSLLKFNLTILFLYKLIVVHLTSIAKILFVTSAKTCLLRINKSVTYKHLT